MRKNLNDFKVDIIPFPKINKIVWNEMLLQSKNVNFFCSTDYWKVFDEVYAVELRGLNNDLLGGILFSIENVVPFIGSFFKVSRTESSAIVVENKDILENKKLILETLLAYLKKKKVIYLTITPKTRSTDALIFDQLNINSNKCGTYILDLNYNEEIIYKNFSKGCKSSIQKAIKSNVSIKIYKNEEAVKYLSDYVKIQNSMMERRKGQFSALYFKSNDYLKKTLITDFSDSYLAMAYYNEQPAAGAIITAFNNSIFYYQGASDYELTKDSQATNLLHFEIIKYAKKHGYEKYDFGGANIHSKSGDALHGVYSFKKSFGGIGLEYDCGSIVLNKFRFTFIWKFRNLQNNSIVKFIVKVIRKI